MFSFYAHLLPTCYVFWLSYIQPIVSQIFNCLLNNTESWTRNSANQVKPFFSLTKDWRENRPSWEDLTGEFTVCMDGFPVRSLLPLCLPHQGIRRSEVLAASCLSIHGLFHSPHLPWLVLALQLPSHFWHSLSLRSYRKMPFWWHFWSTIGRLSNTYQGDVLRLAVKDPLGGPKLNRIPSIPFSSRPFRGQGMTWIL